MAEPPGTLVDANVVTVKADAGDQAPQPGGKGAIPTPHSLAGMLGRLGLGRYTGVVLLLAFIAIFSLWLPSTFPTSSTVKIILSTQGVTAVLAIAVLFPLAAGSFDLSAAGTLGLTALVCGSLMSNAPHMSPLLAIALALLMAAGIGAFNGLLIAFVGVNSFIATLGTSSLLTAFLGLIDAGNYVGPFPSSFAKITSGTPLGIPIVAIYALAIAVLAWYFLEHTPPGRRVYATGANVDAARLAGVRTRRYVFFSLVICGVIAGIAGILLASSSSSIDETSGTSYLLPAYAAAFLATTQIKPGRFNVWGTMLAIVVLGTGVQGLQLAGAQVWVTDMFNGVALIAAVSVSALLEHRRGRREKARTAAAGT
jgi:ribose transport system permease protein